jgi:hypothetical protein
MESFFAAPLALEVDPYLHSELCTLAIYFVNIKYVITFFRAVCI